MAVLTGAHFISHALFNGTLARMDMGGGAPRAILQDVQGADWNPDGSGLAVIRAVNGKSRLEYPVGKVLYETAGYVSDLRFSPRGDQIAFMDHPLQGDDRGSVDLVDLEGHKKVLTDGYTSEEGLAWARGGAAIYFAAQRESETVLKIFEVTPSGRVRDVFASADNLFLEDANGKGDLLATGNTFVTIVKALGPGSSAERDFSWLDASSNPAITGDGKQMLFTEEDAGAGLNYALLLQALDGSPPVRLGEGVSMGFSPDGTWALSLLPGPPSQLVLYPTGAGEKRVLDHGNILTYSWGMVFHDGTHALACGNEMNHGTRCYMQDIAGGQPRPITAEGTSWGIVSRDDKSVLASGKENKFFIYPVAGGAAQPVPWLAPDESVIRWTVDGRGVLVYRRMQIPTLVELVDLATGRRTKVRELSPADRAGVVQISEVAFSDDKKSYAYSYTQNVSRLAVIEGVK